MFVDGDVLTRRRLVLRLAASGGWCGVERKVLVYCWNYYQLLRLHVCHDYVIMVLSPTFLSYLSHLFAYELPRSNGIYLCITAFFASFLSTCQHLSVPTPLFPHFSPYISGLSRIGKGEFLYARNCT